MHFCQKSFYMVDHSILLGYWGESFIYMEDLEVTKSIKIQKIKVNVVVGSNRKIKHGVLQGSVHGSLLFVI